MELPEDKQEELRNLKDEVYAALETGNHEYARTVGKLMREQFPAEYLQFRCEIINDYSFNI